MRKRILFSLALGLLAILAAGLDALTFAKNPIPVLLATTATYGVTTSASDLNKMWRKVQGDVATAIQFESEEWELLDGMDEYEIDWSAREITIPVDIIEGYGVASIPEGGYEARPSSPNLRELTISWVLFNGRFTVSKTAKWIDQNNRNAMIERQIVQQGRSKVRAIAAHFSDYFYGFSTGYLARVDDGGSALGSASSHTIPLRDAYGVAGIDNAAYIAQLLKVGDHVALVRAGALVTNAIGEVTAVTPGTPSIGVTWNGSVDPEDGDYVVKANALENTTLAGTDYNRGLVGILDGMTSTSVHSLSNSTDANWDVAYSDTSGGRFSGIRLQRARDEIQNEGPGQLNTVIWAQGVKRDVVSQYQGAVRFDDPMGMEIDGSVKSKGVRFFTSRRVPPGYVFAQDRRSFRKMTLIPKPNKPMWDDGYKLENQSGFVFPIDYPCGLVHLARKNYAYFSGLTEA